ncbi:MAG: CoA-transferase [Dehalococcoidia bacterium]
MAQAADCTLEELLAILMSREVRDFETSACGALSFIPAAGLLLAEATHAPHGRIIILDSPAYYPFVSPKDFHYLAQRGQLDLFFISAIEIDREANFNLHLIGDPDAPKVRMGGQFGTGLLYYAVPRIIIFRTKHDRRTFVEKVSFVSGAATSPEGMTRRTRGVKVMTPLAILELDQQTRLLELVSVHPGHTMDEVQANTGFDLQAGKEVQTTLSVTEEELTTLRTVVKQRMIETDTYADLARSSIREP